MHVFFLFMKFQTPVDYQNYIFFLILLNFRDRGSLFDQDIR